MGEKPLYSSLLSCSNRFCRRSQRPRGSQRAAKDRTEEYYNLQFSHKF